MRESSYGEHGVPPYNPLRVVSFKMEQDLIDKLDEIARRKRMSRSELIRRAIKQYLQEIDCKYYETKRVRVPCH